MGLQEALPQTADQFLVWAECQEAKYEYVEGLVMMQAGASRDHERVAKRIFVSLFRQVEESEFDVNKGDFGVRLGEGRGEGSVLLPDVLVDIQTGDGKEHATTTPVVVIEVLSPSTDLNYHVEKLQRYAQLASLAHYAVFSQDDPVAYVWHKTQAGWPEKPDLVSGFNEAITFPDIGATLLMSEIYASAEPRLTNVPR